MCHFHESDEWNRARKREPEPDEESEDDEIPSFLNEETDTDVEIVTDGGEE